MYAGHKHFKLICSASKTIQVQVWSAHSHKWPKPKLSPQALADINASNCCIRHYQQLTLSIHARVAFTSTLAFGLSK